MSNILNTSGKWVARAAALKVGKAAMKRGGVIGIGIGAVVGVGYLAYNFIKKRNDGDLRKIEDIHNNNHEIEGDKKIVI